MDSCDPLRFDSLDFSYVAPMFGVLLFSFDGGLFDLVIDCEDHMGSDAFN